MFCVISKVLLFKGSRNSQVEQEDFLFFRPEILCWEISKVVFPLLETNYISNFPMGQHA